MITAIDSNILFDVLLPDLKYAAESERALEMALAHGTAIISEPVLTELAARFPDSPSLQDFLAKSRIRLERSSEPALHAAGTAWARYTRNRPPGLICTECGNPEQVLCSDCKQPITTRQHVPSDFLIGAHALIHADRLLTRDRGYFRTYFPNLELI